MTTNPGPAFTRERSFRPPPTAPQSRRQEGASTGRHSGSTRNEAPGEVGPGSDVRFCTAAAPRPGLELLPLTPKAARQASPREPGSPASRPAPEAVRARPTQHHLLREVQAASSTLRLEPAERRCSGYPTIGPFRRSPHSLRPLVLGFSLTPVVNWAGFGTSLEPSWAVASIAD